MEHGELTTAYLNLYKAWAGLMVALGIYQGWVKEMYEGQRMKEGK